MEFAQITVAGAILVALVAAVIVIRQRNRRKRPRRFIAYDPDRQ